MITLAIFCVALTAFIICAELHSAIKRDEQRQHWADFVRDNNIKARRALR